MDGEDRKEAAVALVVIVVLAVLALASLLVAFGYYCYIRSKVSEQRKALNNNRQRNEENEETKSGGGGGEQVEVAVVGERGVQLFTYKQLHSATGGFGKGNAVGHGSFGSVYRGVLPDGRKVAVKLMDRGGKQGEDEFKMEVL